MEPWSSTYKWEYCGDGTDNACWSKSKGGGAFRSMYFNAQVSKIRKATVWSHHFCQTRGHDDWWGQVAIYTKGYDYNVVVRDPCGNIKRGYSGAMTNFDVKQNAAGIGAYGDCVLTKYW
jgi:hypothetical protein